MTRLSVNINKLATLRNARGGNMPNLIQSAKDIERFGAEGITVHPRPDERHIRYQDALELKEVVTTEYNIEGKPVEKFMDLVLKVKPTQVTLVPDAEDPKPSNASRKTITNKPKQQEDIRTLKSPGIRTSIFVDPVVEMVQGAAETGTDRIELYTESYASQFADGNKEEAVKPFAEAAIAAQELNLGLNAGHDLSLDNIAFFKENVPNLLEVSIGHALICEAIYMGLDNVINLYKHRLK